MFRRSLLTESSKTMVPTYPMLAGWIGLAYVFGDRARTATPSFNAAKDIGSIELFGYAFLTVSLCQLAAMLMHKETPYVMALALGLGLSLAWAGFFGISIFTTANASLTAPALWLFVARAHWATFKSITQDAQAIKASDGYRDI